MRHLIIAAIILFAASSAAAQTGSSLAARPDRGITPGGAYSVSDLDSVSLTGGGLNVSIPLASLPPVAGGRLGVTISATYNSKLWNVARREVRAPGTIGFRTYVVDEPRPSDRAGWSVSGPGCVVVFRNAHEDFDYVVPQQSETDITDWAWLQHSWWRAYLVTQDGAEHELTPSDQSSAYGGMSRTYLVGSYSSTPNLIHAPMRYHTADGTYLDVLVYPDGGPTSWVVTAADGTQTIRYGDGSQRIRDANNNSVRFYGDAEGTHYVDEQTGRELKITGDQAGTKVWYQTVGGAWQHIDVNFGTTRVRGKFYSVNDWNPSLHTETGGDGDVCVRDAVLDQEIQVVREIVFPATEPGKLGRRFSFGYDSDATEQFTTDYMQGCGTLSQGYTTTSSLGLGELSQVTTPSGAVVDYTYNETQTHRFLFNADDITRDIITSKKITHDGGLTDTWTYDLRFDNGGGSVTNPDGTVVSEVAYISDPGYGYQSGTANGLGGKVYRTRSGNVLVERRWRSNPAGAQTLAPSGGSAVNPLVEAEFTSLIENNVAVRMAAKTHQYDLNGNLLQTREYDWFDPALVTRDGAGIPQGVPAGATLLRQTDTSYYNTAADGSSPNLYSQRTTSGSTLIINAPQQTTVGAGVTKFSYDGQGYGTAPTAGNLTKVEQWDSAANAWVTTSSTYGAYGNKATATDAGGNVTQFFYEDATHALPTRAVVDPLNGTGQQTTLTSYDYYTGLVTSRTDANGNVTDIDYTNQLLGTADPLGRPGVVRSPADALNGGQRRTAKTYYEDEARVVRTESDLRAEGDGLLKARTTADQMGRAVLVEQSEDGVNYTVSTRTVYEQGGRVSFTSNPYRSTGATTDGWARTTRDTAGRVAEVATFAGREKPDAGALCDANSGCTGRVTTAYYAEYTTVTDQAGKVRRSRADALGRLVRVDEAADAANTLGAYDAPLQPTCYAYDVLGDLTEVRQGGQWQSQNGVWQCVGGQQRTFQYSTLSRLTSATNPEGGTISYEYYPNGNLKKKTDPRVLPNTQTNFENSYQYDGLNRVTSRTYNDGTPNVSYFYDSQALPAGAPALAQGQQKGQLLAVTYGAAGSTAGSYYGHDALGRVSSSAQVTGTDAGPQTYTLPSYTYDLSGNLTGETYPSGRVVVSEYDAAGRLAGVRNGQSGPFYAGGAATDQANRLAYTAAGGVSSVRLGNGLWEHTTFNSRVQPVQISLGTTSNDSGKLQLDYSYGTTDNNGNVQSQTITVPGMIGPVVQSYAYDELNRLKTAQETGGGSQSWQQVFAYDRFGNRTFGAGTTSPAVPQGQEEPTSNPAISAATNRITSAGYQYDAAGNLTAKPGWAGYAYDAENRMVSADSGQPLGQSAYSYDGEGRRVKKVTGSNSAETIFVYDVAGRLAAEYATTPAQPNGTQYLTQDNLGTPRVITNAQGGVVSRHDYFPFGGEIQGGTGGRTTSQGYSQPDGVRNRFTGKERDDETGLDYFGARYYASTQGRFTGPDGLLCSGRLEDPQTWNRYSYVLNNPLAYTDPTGFYEYAAGTDNKYKQRFEAQLQRAKDQLDAIKTRYGANSKEYTDAKRALDAYGTPGDKNGVIVAFGKTSEGGAGETSGLFAKDGTKSITVTIDMSQNKSDNRLLGTIAHEGSHVQDRADLVDGILKAGGEGEANAAITSFNFTKETTETRAYTVESVMAEFTYKNEQPPESHGGEFRIGLGEYAQEYARLGKTNIWNPSWAGADIAKVRANRAAAISKGLHERYTQAQLDQRFMKIP